MPLFPAPGTDGPVLSEAESTGQVAASLRAMRRSRKISRRQLAQLAGVTASAISQAERGLSRSTLVRLCGKLELTVDDFVQGEDPPTYPIGRRVGDPRRGPERAMTLLGGITSDLRIDLVHLGPREAGAPIERQEGEGIVAVSRGPVRVHVGDQTAAIRDGEVLLTECSRVDGWRNLGDRDAALFWTVVAPRS